MVRTHRLQAWVAVAWLIGYVVAAGGTSLGAMFLNATADRAACTCPAGVTPDHRCPMHKTSRTPQTCVLVNASSLPPIALWTIELAGVMPVVLDVIAPSADHEPLSMTARVAPPSRSDAPDAPPPRT